MTRSIVIDFVNAINVDIYRRWVAGGKQEPVEKLIDIANRITVQGLNGIFK